MGGASFGGEEGGGICVWGEGEEVAGGEEDRAGGRGAKDEFDVVCVSL